MKKFVLIAFLSCYAAVCFGWGQKGHDVVALIAEKHLSAQAKESVKKYLHGYPMVYYANWLDNVRNNPAYAESVTWHYTNVDEGQSYQTMPKPSTGDILDGIRYSIRQMKDPASNDSIKTQYLKYLIHLLGDLHCPMHAGRASDLGGNRYPLKWMGQNTNLHKVWDEFMPEKSHAWSATEWVSFIDLPTTRVNEAYTRGNPEQWILETVEISKDIYKNSPENGNLSWDYLHQYTPLVEQQFLKGGYRLASILNELFR